jgi:dihydrofolate reductase
MDRIDACLLGGRMYPGYEQYWTAIQQAPEQPLPMTGKLAHPAELTWSNFARRTPHYVLSATLPAVTWTQSRVLRKLNEVRELKEQTGKDIYLMGGAMLTGSLLDAGLVDEIHVIVHPLLAGPARGPFDAVIRRRALTLLQHRALGEGRLHLSYQVG